MQPPQIKQDVILSTLHNHGVEVTRERLQAFLDANCANVGRLVLEPRGREIDADAPCGPHTSRWYYVVSREFDTDSATDHVIAHILAHGLEE